MPTIEGIANQALDLIGYKRHIGNVYEGSAASVKVLDLWGQTRDELLIQMKPDWAKKDAPLTLLRTAPDQYDPITPWSSAYPPLPWKYEYGYPVDCVHDLQIKVTPWLFPIWRPRPMPYRLNYTTGIRTILTNEPSAILIYISNAFNPDDWEPDFIWMMVVTLAKKLSSSMPAKEKEEDGGDTAR